MDIKETFQKVLTSIPNDDDVCQPRDGLIAEKDGRHGELRNSLRLFLVEDPSNRIRKTGRET